VQIVECTTVIFLMTEQHQLKKDFVVMAYV
jgi:hypothetical protein